MINRALPVLLLLGTPALLSTADPLASARAEAKAAEREAQRLEAAAKEERNEADRLRARQAAAAQEILAAEAKLAAAEIEQGAIARALEVRSARLAEKQRPTALLLAGVVQMGRRPPLLTLAQTSTPEEFVTVRALLDASLPVMRARTEALRADLEQVKRLAEQASASRVRLAQQRDQLRASQLRFAALERQANDRFAELGGAALQARDVAIARGAQAEELQGRAAAQRSAARLAAAMLALPQAPPRPLAPDSRGAPAPLEWIIPVQGSVQTGLSEISSAGVRSRGLTFANSPGAQVLVPANGKIAFAGPFRQHDGIVIIDHGGGWMTLITEVRTPIGVGESVEGGQRLGAALGPVTVELTRNGRPQPAALIAGSSRLLSNGGKSG